MSKYRVFRTVGRSGMGGGTLQQAVIEMPPDVPAPPGAEIVEDSTPLSSFTDVTESTNVAESTNTNEAQEA